MSCALPGGASQIVIVDWKDYETVWQKDFECYEKKPSFGKAFDDMLGNGIFNSDGHQWKRARRISSHLFSKKILSTKMVAVFDETSTELLVKLKEYVDQPVDMFNMAARLTLQAFSDIAFGAKFPLVRSAPETVPFAEAFDRGFDITMLRFFDPLWPVKRLFGIGEEAKMSKHTKIIKEFMGDIVTQRLQGGTRDNDIVSLFLKDNPKTEFRDLQDIVINFILAGRDTTACLISWFIYEMSKNQIPIFYKK
eukprot:UN24248